MIKGLSVENAGVASRLDYSFQRVGGNAAISENQRETN
jgi:hypothetical protein